MLYSQILIFKYIEHTEVSSVMQTRVKLEFPKHHSKFCSKKVKKNRPGKCKHASKLKDCFVTNVVYHQKVASIHLEA